MFGIARRGMRYAFTQPPNRWSQRHGLLIGDVNGQQCFSRAEHEVRIGKILYSVDAIFDQCEETVRRTGQPIMC